MMRELFFLLDEDVYTLYVSVSFADQKHQRKVPDVITSSSETVIASSSGTSQEEGDAQDEVSSILPGHRPSLIHIRRRRRTYATRRS